MACNKVLCEGGGSEGAAHSPARLADAAIVMEQRPCANTLHCCVPENYCHFMMA